MRTRNARHSFLEPDGVKRAISRGKHVLEERSWRDYGMPRVEEGVWDPPEGFTFIPFIPLLEGEVHGDEWGPLENPPKHPQETVPPESLLVQRAPVSVTTPVSEETFCSLCFLLFIPEPQHWAG